MGCSVPCVATQRFSGGGNSSFPTNRAKLKIIRTADGKESRKKGNRAGEGHTRASSTKSGMPSADASARTSDHCTQTTRSTNSVNTVSLKSSKKSIVEAMLQAAGDGDLERLKRIMDIQGVHPDMADEKGRTPLMVASSMGRMKIAQHIVIRRSSSVHSRDSTGETALALAARAGQIMTTKWLVEEAGADPNAAAHSGETVLMSAIRNANPDLVEFLVKAGACPNAADSLGDTPLLLAADAPEPTMLKILLEAKAYPDGRNDAGFTPLTWAACYGLLANVKVLVEVGNADINLPGGPGDGKKAQEWAVELEHSNVLAYLRSVDALNYFSARMNAPERKGRVKTPRRASVSRAHRRSKWANLRTQRASQTYHITRQTPSASGTDRSASQSSVSAISNSVTNNKTSPYEFSDPRADSNLDYANVGGEGAGLGSASGGDSEPVSIVRSLVSR